jgi:hypothetical protein
MKLSALALSYGLPQTLQHDSVLSGSALRTSPILLIPYRWESRGSPSRLRSEPLILLQQGSNDTCHLVGQSHRCEFVRFASEQCRHPLCRCCSTVARKSWYRMRTDLPPQRQAHLPGPHVHSRGRTGQADVGCLAATLKRRLLDAPKALQRRYLRGLVSDIVVNREIAVISGPQDAIASCASDLARLGAVPGSVRKLLDGSEGWTAPQAESTGYEPIPHECPDGPSGVFGLPGLYLSEGWTCQIRRGYQGRGDGPGRA